MTTVLTPARPPALRRSSAAALLEILFAARDSAEPYHGPGAGVPTSPKEGITRERTRPI